jgi:hypothetical protein
MFFGCRRIEKEITGASLAHKKGVRAQSSLVSVAGAFRKDLRANLSFRQTPRLGRLAHEIARRGRLMRLPGRCLLNPSSFQAMCERQDECLG